MSHSRAQWYGSIRNFTSLGVPRIHTNSTLRDEITLTTHRKPWRGPSRLTAKARGVSSSDALKRSLSEETSVMTVKQKKLYQKQTAEQDAILKDVAEGKSMTPPPPPLPLMPAPPQGIKDFAKQAVGALRTLKIRAGSATQINRKTF